MLARHRRARRGKPERIDVGHDDILEIRRTGRSGKGIVNKHVVRLPPAGDEVVALVAVAVAVRRVHEVAVGIKGSHLNNE